MATTRIKDISSTATSAAGDDYLALDGSTNGTRKILASNIASEDTTYSISILRLVTDNLVEPYPERTPD